jgi:hypothetical protein
MYKNIITTICFLLFLYGNTIGQVNPKAQNYLDSLMQLSSKKTADKFEYYGNAKKIGNGFSITTALRYFECNGDLCTEERKGIIKPSGDSILPFFYRVESLPDKRFFLSSDKFQLITDLSFRVLKVFELVEFSDDGFHKVIFDGKSGIVDKNFKEVIPIKYDFVQNFDLYGRAVVRIGKNGWRVLDQDSLLTGKKRVDEFGRMIELIKIRENDKWGFLNERAQLVTPIKYDAALTFPGGYAAGSSDGGLGFPQWAIINYEGKELTPFKYDEIVQHYTWKYTLAKVNGLYGFIDENGKEATPFIYTNIGEDFFYHQGVANYVLVQIRGRKHGVLDQYGKELVPMIYEELKGCWDCESGLQGKINGEWKTIPIPVKK